MKFVKSTLQSYYFSHIDRHGNEVAHAEIIFFIIGLNGISIVFLILCEGIRIWQGSSVMAVWLSHTTKTRVENKK